MMPSALTRGIHQRSEGDTPERIARSVLATGETRYSLDEFHTWWSSRRAQSAYRIHSIPLDEMTAWRVDADTGDIRHDSGKFFSITGVGIDVPGAPVEHWAQPIVRQPEVGILGILMKEIDGVLHCLMQAKFEPGNCNGIQLSPTVQATRSNFTRIHQGRTVPYLDFFRGHPGVRVLADVLQSEQGAWFYQKRNRNIIVETTEDIPVGPEFHWLTLGQLFRLLSVENLLNMDARTVLSCLPFSSIDPHPLLAGATDEFHQSVIRSCSAVAGSLHPTPDILSWVTGIRAISDVHTRALPLATVPRWHLVDGAISHETGLFFNVVGIDVAGGSREVLNWTQPMIEPVGAGVVAFVVKQFDGVLHALVHARVEPGYVDTVELAPTVQCTPDSLLALPPESRPPFLDLVLTARPEEVRFSAVLSEEGGRFLGAVNRYLIVSHDGEMDLTSDYRWMALHQLADLLRHSHYLNVQARSLVACLHSLSLPPGPVGECDAHLPASTRS